MRSKKATERRVGIISVRDAIKPVVAGKLMQLGSVFKRDTGQNVHFVQRVASLKFAGDYAEDKGSISDGLIDGAQTRAFGVVLRIGTDA